MEEETVNVAPAPTNIGTLCNDIAISTKAGLKKCHTACETGQCCFAANEKEMPFLLSNVDIPIRRCVQLILPANLYSLIVLR